MPVVFCLSQGLALVTNCAICNWYSHRIMIIHTPLNTGNNGASPLRDASVNPVKRSGNTNLGTYFRDQLALLLEQIKLTVPHFVRCVKASDRVVQKVAVHAGNTCMQQLICCVGIMFPSLPPHELDCIYVLCTM